MGESWNGSKLTSRTIWYRHITPIKTQDGHRTDKSNKEGRDILSLSWSDMHRYIIDQHAAAL